MTMPLQFPKRLSILTSALLASTLLASLACANNRAATNDTTPNTDATVMGQATPTGDDVRRAPASESTSTATSDSTTTGATTDTTTTRTIEEQRTEETYRAPASTESTETSRKKHSKKKATKPTTEPTTSGTSTGGATNTSVPEGGSTNRDMSQAGPSSTEFSGTSYGTNGTEERSPAAVGGMSGDSESTAQSSDQIPSDKQAMRESARKHHYTKEQSTYQHKTTEPPRESTQTTTEERRPADGRTIVVVQQDVEPELSSKLNALGAPPVQINDDNNPAWKGNDAFDTEPYSRFPYHVGSTQVTGKDKSVAVLEGTNLFTDPNALARNEATREAVVKNQDIDYGRYTYNRRGNFQSTMMSRLNNVGHTLDELSADARLNTQMPRSSVDEIIADLEGRQAAVAERVNYADTISADQWDSYKDSFRTELSKLENSVAQLSAVLR